MTAIISTLRLGVVAAGVYLLAGVASPALAQTPGTGGPQPSAPDPTQVPIDGGGSLLLAAGAAYGLKRLRNARHTKTK